MLYLRALLVLLALSLVAQDPVDPSARCVQNTNNCNSVDDTCYLGAGGACWRCDEDAPYDLCISEEDTSCTIWLSLDCGRKQTKPCFEQACSEFAPWVEVGSCPKNAYECF